jgi:hypothetical protein
MKKTLEEKLKAAHFRPPDQVEGDFTEAEIHVYYTLFEEFKCLAKPMFADFGFELDDTDGIQYMRTVGECRHSILAKLSDEYEQLSMEPMMTIRSVPLWEKTAPNRNPYGQIYAPLAHWTEPRKRKTKGGLRTDRALWLTKQVEILPFTIQEMRQCMAVAVPFMDQFTTTQDIFDGFERGVFIATPPKEQEWIRLVWEGKLDPTKVPIAEYAGPRYSLEFPWRDRSMLGIGQSVFPVRRAKVEELLKFFGGRDPHNWLGQKHLI